MSFRDGLGFPSFSGGGIGHIGDVLGTGFQLLSGFVELRGQAGDAALGGDEQREERSKGDEHPLGQFAETEPCGEQRHPGENGDLADGREGRAEQAREVSTRYLLYVQEVLEEVRQEVQRVARAERRKGM